jgi:hypothetical protein
LPFVPFSHALLVLDHEGSGAGALDALALETQLDEQLKSTWGDRAKAIVITPEVDIWMWGSDKQVGGDFHWIPHTVGIAGNAGR